MTVFGASGFLGSAIVSELEAAGHTVTTAARGLRADRVDGHVNLLDENWPSNVRNGLRFDGVVWAQGVNSTGGVLEESPENLHQVFDANVVFITNTIKLLVEFDLLRKPARTVILSSVWQSTARSSKLGYILAKSALAGLVPSLAIDLSSHGIAVNAVLPGVIESPMARKNLTPEQLLNVQRETLGGDLATANHVAKVTSFLLSPDSVGINAESISVDQGWSKIRYV